MTANGDTATDDDGASAAVDSETVDTDSAPTEEDLGGIHHGPVFPCWPDDRIPLRGLDELRLPSERHLGARWGAAIFDNDGIPPATILEASRPFEVCFRVELSGHLWRCFCANWCFDIGFTAIGAGGNFDLSSKLPEGALHRDNWKGCHDRCIELCYPVPGGTIGAGECGTLYECGARFALKCCDCNKPPVIVGYQSIGVIEFY